MVLPGTTLPPRTTGTSRTGPNERAPACGGRIIGDTESGAPTTKKVHILVKPTRPELLTNLVINTDRRTYLLELRSTEKTYMASVSWQYPEDQLIALRRQNQEADAAAPIASGVDLASINFRYAIQGDNPAWRPLRAANLPATGEPVAHPV